MKYDDLSKQQRQRLLKAMRRTVKATADSWYYKNELEDLFDELELDIDPDTLSGVVDSIVASGDLTITMETLPDCLESPLEVSV